MVAASQQAPRSPPVKEPIISVQDPTNYDLGNLRFISIGNPLGSQLIGTPLGTTLIDGRIAGGSLIGTPLGATLIDGRFGISPWMNPWATPYDTSISGQRYIVV